MIGGISEIENTAVAERLTAMSELGSIDGETAQLMRHSAILLLKTTIFCSALMQSAEKRKLRDQIKDKEVKDDERKKEPASEQNQSD